MEYVGSSTAMLVIGGLRARQRVAAEASAPGHGPSQRVGLAHSACPPAHPATQALGDRRG